MGVVSGGEWGGEEGGSGAVRGWVRGGGGGGVGVGVWQGGPRVSFWTYPLFLCLSMCSDGPLTPTFTTHPPLPFPQPPLPLKPSEGRVLNVTLGHQSTQPPACVSGGKHAKREKKGEGRETLALTYCP